MTMARSEFLLEIGCEEVPARMLEPGTRELGTRLFEELMARQLAPGEVTTTFTPRRLVVVLRDVPGREPDREETMTGPPLRVAYDSEGRPTDALRGFAKRCGLEPDELSEVETPKGKYLAALQKIEGASTIEVLGEIVPKIVRELNWPKSMRWGARQGPWVRPIHSILALLNGEVVPMEIFGVASGNSSTGHSIHSPESFAVSGVESYMSSLQNQGILVDFAERRTVLGERFRSQATECGGVLLVDNDLLTRLASICEVPGVVLGEIDAVDLPREVLITSLRDHQSAFTVESEGELLPFFLTVMDREEDPDGRVRRGNEWVVAARLDDARFFYREDRKTPLIERRPTLERVTFHQQLGNYAEKTGRIASLADWMCRQLGYEDKIDSATAAAELLKCDLTTEMVKEFTSLQGIIGGVYAREDGHPEEVWQAVYDQYLPTSTEDLMPRGIVGQIVSLADRVDSLAGMFGAGFVPTGSKDPFGLRRAAQGAVRIVLECELDLDLLQATEHALGLYGEQIDSSVEESVSALRPFLADRVRYLLGREGFAYDEIEAALAAEDRDLPALRRRVMALHDVRDQDDFLDVVLAAKRIANIVRGTEAHEVDEKLFVEAAEKELAVEAEALQSALDGFEETDDYRGALASISGFAAALDRFFVDVLVMADDSKLRTNRLALLQAIDRQLARVARLTEMVVERPNR
jgi:glycyl-tRNA synthetase beta chain